MVSQPETGYIFKKYNYVSNKFGLALVAMLYYKFLQHQCLKQCQ